MCELKSFFILLLLVIQTMGCLEIDREFTQKETKTLQMGQLPGIGPYSKSLNKKLKEKLKGMPSTYTPRTKHLNEGQTPRFTNRLILETSPYLRQHAHNPVNWFSYGEEAFQIAKKLNRPVFLSVGYSTCHWCHVMEEESFEDMEIAAYINSNYIAIKVDREERPDVDAIYMKAVQVITGSGGWPMNVWLLPNKKPYYGGTYFPPRDGDRGTSLGFLTVLKRLKNIYSEEQDKVQDSSLRITEYLQKELSLEVPAKKALLKKNIIEDLILKYSSHFDHKYGGLNSSPKFPSGLPISLLLRSYHKSKNKKILNMAEVTLKGMLYGGIYDHVGGGFHRYSVDKKWLVPHFEKMLYDNALLAQAYLEAYLITKNLEYKRGVEETIDYLIRDMKATNGGFYSATDADSENDKGHKEEGYYFTWTEEELKALLNPKEYTLFSNYYDISKKGHFEGRNILWAPHQKRKSPFLTKINLKLYSKRQERKRPLRDEKIITAWNGMVISTLVKAGFSLSKPQYIEEAKKTALFIQNNMYKKNQLFRSFKEGDVKHIAYLEDYAFYIEGLLYLFEFTGEIEWLQFAIRLDKDLKKFYEDSLNGGFYRTHKMNTKILVREIPTYDGAEPSGNSVQLLNLYRLESLTAKDEYRERAEKLVNRFRLKVSERPMDSTKFLLALQFHWGEPREVLLVSSRKSSFEKTQHPFVDEIKNSFVHPVVFVWINAKNSEPIKKVLKTSVGKKPINNKLTAYICKKGLCKLPQTSGKLFKK